MLRINSFIFFVSLIFMGLYQSIQPTSLPLQRYGNLFQILLPVGAMGISLLSGDIEGVYWLTEGAIYSQESTEILKRSVAETRPNKENNLSFPSGHTISAMNASAFLMLRYGVIYGIPSAFLACLVGYSRVNAHQHYWHDVLASTIIALLLQIYIHKYSKRAKFNNKKQYFHQLIRNCSIILVLCSIPFGLGSLLK